MTTPYTCKNMLPHDSDMFFGLIGEIQIHSILIILEYVKSENNRAFG